MNAIKAFGKVSILILFHKFRRDLRCQENKLPEDYILEGVTTSFGGGGGGGDGGGDYSVGSNQANMNFKALLNLRKTRSFYMDIISQ